MSEVKLIIWDLDDTLWQGTLADHEQVVLNQSVVEKIQFLLNRGIVHSICSKNDSKQAEKILTKFGIYDLFIFPMISFEDKGPRVKQIIEKAQLREENVLFVDDNAFVLREVAFHNPNIMTRIIDDFLLEDVSHWGKNDSGRERLSQYKILEKKQKNKLIFIEKLNDEQAFLKECMIEIQLSPLNIDDEDVERVIELVNRSNQMNFTKSRFKYDYLFTLFELKNGTNFKIRVKDKYGDYGIAGYVCILNNTVLHFVFSCRILGMCVEAKTYQWIKENHPQIKWSFDGSKLNQIDSNLDFITIAVKQDIQSQTSLRSDKKILVRGPCIANAISFLLNESFHVEEEIFSFFEYANLHFLRKYLGSKKDKRFEKSDKAVKNNAYGTIVNFLESDYYSGHYMIRNQLTPVASNYIFWKNLRTLKQDNKLLSEHVETMILDGMHNIKKFNIGNRFSPWPRLEKIANTTVNWFGAYWRKILYRLMMYFGFKNYCGYVSVSEFEQDLKWYIGLFPEHTQLIFINPPEKLQLPLLNESQRKTVTQRTQALNGITRTIAQEKPNVFLLEMDHLLEQDDIVDSFSHLKRQGYIKLSQPLLKLVRDWKGGCAI